MQDYAATMTKALDSANSGGTVEFAPGTYRMGDISLRDGVKVSWLAPLGGVKIVHDDSPGPMIRGKPQSFLADSIDFDGRQSQRTDRSPLLDMALDKADFTDCSFQNTCRASIRLTRVVRGSIKRSSFRDMAPGSMVGNGNSQAILIQANDPGRVVVEDCEFSSSLPASAITPGGIAVSCQPSKMAMVITNCSFTRIGQSIPSPVNEYTGAVYLYRNCDMSVIHGNRFYDCTFCCISSQRGSMIRITDNAIFGSVSRADYAIRVGNRDPLIPVDGVWISGNYVRDWGGEAINLEFDPGFQVRGLSVTNNRIMNCDSGIKIKQAYKDCVVTGNMMSGVKTPITAIYSLAMIRDNAIE